MPVPVLRSGETHDLRAEIEADEMKVFADNQIVLEGSLGPEAVSFDGPVGIRSDNARLQIELRAGPPLEAKRGQAPAASPAQNNPNSGLCSGGFMLRGEDLCAIARRWSVWKLSPQR